MLRWAQLVATEQCLHSVVVTVTVTWFRLRPEQHTLYSVKCFPPDKVCRGPHNCGHRCPAHITPQPHCHPLCCVDACCAYTALGARCHSHPDLQSAALARQGPASTLRGFAPTPAPPASSPNCGFSLRTLALHLTLSPYAPPPKPPVCIYLPTCSQLPVEKVQPAVPRVVLCATPTPPDHTYTT
jgi:hypothetical protein